MKKELSNYIPVNRKFFDHPFWKKERAYSEAEAWLWLLKEARFEVSEGNRLIKGKVVKWNRGELLASLRTLGLEWSWDKNKVGRFLDLLISEKMISKRTANGTDQTIITLCNYDSYNSRAEKSGQSMGQARDTGGTVTGQQRDNTNKENKGNTEEEGLFAGVPPKYTQDQEDKFKQLQSWILKEAPNVAKMKQPLTIAEYVKLKEHFSAAAMADMFKRMHNYRPLLTKNLSAYLTFKNWSGKDFNNPVGNSNHYAPTDKAADKIEAAMAKTA